MNTRMRTHQFFNGLFMLSVLFSCTTKKTIYSANCNGKELTLQLVTKKKFSTIDYQHELLYGGKLVDVINYSHLGYKPPYSPAVYGTAPWHLIDTTRQPYQPTGYDIPLDKIPVMVYVDTTILTRPEFDAFYDCLKQHHKAMQTAMEKVPEFQAYQYGGIVYGSREQFEQRYVKNKNDYFIVYPDGRTSHTLIESLMTTTSSGGLGNVIMPGKRILVNTAQRPMAELETYRNTRTNRPLSADFTFDVDTAFHSR